MSQPTRCRFPDCRTVAIHHTGLDLCHEHRNHLALALLPTVYRKWPIRDWYGAVKEYEVAFGPIDRKIEQPRHADPLPRSTKHAEIVYFIVTGARVKIGTTTNIKHRMANMALPGDAKLTHTIPGGRRLEQEFHTRFRAHRIGGSEWFHVRADLADFLSAIEAGGTAA